MSFTLSADCRASPLRMLWVVSCYAQAPELLPTIAVRADRVRMLNSPHASALSLKSQTNLNCGWSCSTRAICRRSRFRRRYCKRVESFGQFSQHRASRHAVEGEAKSLNPPILQSILQFCHPAILQFRTRISHRTSCGSRLLIRRAAGALRRPPSRHVGTAASGTPACRCR